MTFDWVCLTSETLSLNNLRVKTKTYVDLHLVAGMFLIVFQKRYNRYAMD